VTRAAAPLVFGVALVVRALTAAGITFPVPEDSAYYVDTARNLAAGRGLITDSLWSFASQPLAVPRPAFDLWQPLATFLAAPLMTVFGPALAAAQVPSVVLGAAVAPLAWLLARDAARQAGLAAGRVDVVAFTSGLLVALTPLLVIQAAEPDSSAPYTFFAVASCAVVARAVAGGAPRPWPWVVLGVAIGLAYLARTDAVYVVVASVVIGGLAIWRGRAARPANARPASPEPANGRPASAQPANAQPAARRALEPRIATPPGPALGLLVAALIALPWVIRQATTWQGTALGQLFENAWLVRWFEIFGWSARPTLGSYLAIGPGALTAQRVDAFVGDVLLLLIAAFPAALLGLVVLLARPRLAMLSALRPLTLVALLTFAGAVLVFPIAGRAGLWAHGSGPVTVLLAIAGAFGLEAVVARIGGSRGWNAPTGAFSRAGLIPALVVAIVAAPLVSLAATLEHERATTTGAAYAALATIAERWDLPAGRPIVTDHPMWLAETLDHPTLALPREPPASIVQLVRHFRAVAVVVREEDLDVAATTIALAAYRDAAGRACFNELPAVAPFRAFRFACDTETAGNGEP
jgi:hypothetical protein